MRWALVVAALCACEGSIGSPSLPGATPTPTPSATPSASPTPSPSPGEPTPLPAGIRRLTQREVIEGVESLLPGNAADADALPADTRQSDFTRNRAQIVDPIFAGALEALAREAASRAVDARWAQLVPCAQGAEVSAGCAESAVRGLAERAFRGPIEAEVLTALLAVYQVGVAEGDAKLGVRLVLEALLQSPSFVYARELGASLDHREIAESLALLFTGRPPDAALLAAPLDTAASRVAEATRLYALPESRAHLGRALLEWLAVDRLLETAKDANTYPDFFALRPAMDVESRALVEGALERDTVRTLLTTTEVPASAELRALYGGSARPGILSRAAFLSVYAAPAESSPVRRGNAVLERLLCIELPLPINLMIDIVPPIPDPRLTTRERYAQHSRDAACANCHSSIDPLGFAFEGFDGMGRARTMENGKPIDTQVSVAAGPVAGAYADHAQLIARLAEAREVRACFARNVLRFAAGTRAASFEDPLVERALARTGSSVLDILLAYVESDAFVTRSP